MSLGRSSTSGRSSASGRIASSGRSSQSRVPGDTFNPTSISNMSLWLKSDTGTTIVAGGVDSWSDQSGSGNNASAIGSSNRPTLTAGGQNGYPYLSFDGTNGEMQTTAGALTGDNSHTIVFVGNNTSSISGTKGYIGYGKGNNSPGNETSSIGLTTAGSTGIWFGGQNDVLTSGDTQETNVPAIHIKLYDQSQNFVTGYYKGFPVIYRKPGAYAISTTAIIIGNFFDAFAPGRMPCKVYEIIIWNKLLSRAELSKVNAYLRAKYNLSA